MLIFDQLKKNDPQLRALAIGILAGLCVLAAGLWWVQIVSAREYQASQETQSSRTVRMPAVRGKILDRNGAVLAENRPVYNVSLYLDDFRKEFDKVSSNRVWTVRRELKAQREAAEKTLPPRFHFLGFVWPGHLSKAQQKQFSLSLEQVGALKRQSRYEVCSNLVVNLQALLKVPQPMTLNPTNFEKHYLETRALPYPIITNLTPAQVALVQEKCASWTGVDLELVSTRVYPYQNTAAHIVGYVRRNKDSMEGDPAYYNYRLEGFQGQLGIEAGMDKELRGKAGSKVVLVNSAGYRQTENTDTPVEAGSNVVLTIDLDLQTATEKALRLNSLPKKAAVVMDVRTGDILAMASMPAYNPNSFVGKLTDEEYKRLNDPELMPQMNRATQGRYAPGSIFKTVVGMGLLERGLDPLKEFNVAPDPRNPAKGIIYVGSGKGIQDQARPGLYDFKKALIHSSNSYFITNGILVGIENAVELGLRLHLGEKTGIPTHQENAGEFLNLDRIRSRWYQGNTANFCIGQDPVLVTPLQMAVAAAAIANGGTVLYPRLVDRIYPSDPAVPPDPIIVPSRIRDHLRVSQRTMRIMHEAMLADVEDPGGTGTAARVPEMRVCAKTGTAQVKDPRGRLLSHNVWFLSFAPYPQPKYAVVVMVEGGTSGGGDCAPLAGDIYRAIVQWEKKAAAPKPLAARN